VIKRRICVCVGVCVYNECVHAISTKNRMFLGSMEQQACKSIADTPTVAK